MVRHDGSSKSKCLEKLRQRSLHISSAKRWYLIRAIHLPRVQSLVRLANANSETDLQVVFSTGTGDVPPLAVPVGNHPPDHKGTGDVPPLAGPMGNHLTARKIQVYGCQGSICTRKGDLVGKQGLTA